MGLAKQNARKEGMYQVPKRYTPHGGGEEEYPAFVNQQEMALLKQQGGKGFMTPYGIPSFELTDEFEASTLDDAETVQQQVQDYQSNNPEGGNTTPTAPAPAPKKPTYSFSYDSSLTLGQNIDRIDIAGWWDSLGDNKPKGVTKENAKDYLDDNPEVAQQAITQQGGPEAAAAATEGAKQQEQSRLSGKRESKIEGVMKDSEGRTADDPDYDESSAKMDTTDSYEGYKQEAKGLGAEAKDITGQFGEDATKLAGYQSKFDTMAADAKTRGDKAETFQQGQGVKYATEAGKGQTAATEAAADIKTATKSGVDAAARGETAAGTGVTAAGEGAEGYKAGATDVGAVKEQFGKEGFQKEAGGYQSQIEGMAEKAVSGDVGQRQAAMLKGQMEEGRMASQKGSEEKLRRSMAQSGASPAEIASKVAQFQKQSASDQAQAGRSEALSSQLQGQQMGQSQLAQGAGLTGQAAGMLGQKAGMAGQQASLGAQQAALRGQGAAMNMKGAQMGMQGAQMGMQGAQMGMQGAQQAGQMGMQGAQMGMQGVQGQSQMYAQGTQAGFQGAGQQASMMGQGIGAIQAAGGARAQQMAGLGTQGQFIDQQGNYTQAQLNDIMAQQTQAYNAEQTEATRAANAAANSGGGGGGGGFNLFKPSSWSDVRLKDNIQLLKEGKDGDPNIYSFKYKWDSDTTWSGVMAQELLNTKHADAVKMSPEGYYKVDYHKLGIPMTQLST